MVVQQFTILSVSWRNFSEISENFTGQAQLDGVLDVDDTIAVEMTHYLLKNEGLFLGVSSGLNVASAGKFIYKSKATKKILRKFFPFFILRIFFNFP